MMLSLFYYSNGSMTRVHPHDKVHILVAKDTSLKEQSMRKMQLSFFKKLFILMLVVNIPLVISIVVFCYKSLRAIREDTVRVAKNSQENIVRMVETDTNYVQQQLYHISNMNDWDVLCETNRSDITYEGVTALNQFRSRFQNVLGTSRFFEDIWANIEAADLRFSVNDGMDDFNKEEYAAFSFASADGTGRFKGRDGQLYIVSRNGWNHDISVITVAELDLEKLRNMMAEEKRFQNEQMVLVFQGASEPVYICAGASDELYQLLKSKKELQEKPDEAVIRDKILVHTSSSLGDFDIYSFVAEKDIYAGMREFYITVVWIMAGSILVVLAYGFIVSKMLQKPVQILSEGFQKVELGDFSVRLNREGEDEFAVLYQRFNTMAEKLAQLIDENYVKELYAQKAVYKQLQSQINPHFLYNSFFVLQNMIQDEDTENAAEFAQSLSKYFRFITKTERQEVLLKEETEHARTYLEIMKKRYGHRLEYCILCEDPACLNVPVPRLILQPFIENVFKHGFHSGRDALQITIRILHKEKDIFIRIEDNGSGVEEQRLKELTEELTAGNEKNESAIFNIHKRIQIMFGTSYGVCVENNETGGCRVCLHLPDQEMK